MALMVVNENIQVNDSEDEMLANPDEVNNYKGMYQNDEDDQEQRYYEFGAHFPYKFLYEKLKNIADTIAMNQKVKYAEENNSLIAFNPSRQSDNKHPIKCGVNKNNFESMNKRLEDDKNSLSRNSSKQASINLVNNGTVNMIENVLLALNVNNKSRNIGSIDKLYKSNIVVTVKNEITNHLNIDTIEEKKYNKENSTFQVEGNKGSKSTSRNIVSSNSKKEENKIFLSFTNDIIKFKNNIKNKKNLNKKKNSEEIKKPNPVIVLEKNQTPGKNYFNTKSKRNVNNSNNSNNININTYKNVIVKVNNEKVPQIKILDNLNQIKYVQSLVSTNSVLTTKKLKNGRNIKSSQLNPHNTNNHLNNSNKLKSIERELKNPKFGKNARGNSDAYRYITSSIENRDSGSIHIGKTNFEIGIRIIDNKNNSLSPNRVNFNNISNKMSEGNENLNSISSIMPDSKAITKEKSVTNNPAIESELDDIVSNIKKNNDNKSRNLQRNNLPFTKSNLLHNDKAHSMQFGSYHKNYLLTQANVKTSKNKNVIVSEANRTKDFHKTFLNTNQSSKNSKTNLENQIKLSRNIIKKIFKSNNNGNDRDKNDKKSLSKNLVKNSFNIQKNISNKNETKNRPKINSFPRQSENLKNSLIICNKGESYPNKLNNPLKVDSSKMNTKSNSITSSNISNGMNNSTQSKKNIHYFNKNSKVSNASYLNLKKNEFSIGRRITSGPSDKSSKARINTLSSGSIDKNLIKSSHDSSPKFTISDKP